jgi:pimeloyl-ACP methyl ester carboxylesterase
MFRARAISLAIGALCFGCARGLPRTSTAENADRSAVATTPIASSSTVRKGEPAAVLDGSFEVGALRLHLRCEGSGAPLVVFEAGLGLDSSTWHLVQPEVAKVTRACAYDRAGRGLSGPAPYPHDQRRMAEELHALLTKAGQPGPYVLVGHSLGAANVRWFLNAHPTEVAGMVLIDPATEDWPSKVLARVPLEAQPEFWQNLRAWEGIEREAYVAGYEDLRAATVSLGSRPLFILTAGKPENELSLRLEMHDPLQRLATNTKHVIVKDSAHNIHLENPASVVAAVQAVIRAARTRSRLSDASLAQ